MKERIKKSTKIRSVKLITIVILAIVLFLIVQGIMLQPEITDNYDEIAELEDQIEYEKQRAAEADALKAKVDTDGYDDYIEKIAREKLGMIKKDEILFVDVTGEE